MSHPQFLLPEKGSINEKGSPIKRPCQEKTRLHCKNFSFFAGSNSPSSTDFGFAPFSASLFSFGFWFWAYFDPHQPACACLTQTGPPSGSRSNYCLLLELALSTVFPFLLRCQVTLVRARKSYRSLNINVSSKRNIFHNCFF